MAGGIWGQTRNLGGRTLDPVELSKRRSAVQAGCGTRIWGQTRSYGDTYHWAFHDGTVEWVSAVPVFF